MGDIFGRPGPVEIHHIAGRTASHCKVHVGHWLILPVTNESHREVERLPKDEQKGLFLDLCRRRLNRYQSLPFDGDTMFACMDWHR